MSGTVTIGGLPLAPLVNSSDVVPISQGGVTKQAAVSQILASTGTSPVYTTLGVTGTTTLGSGAANYLTITGATTGNGPTITAAGSDTNINLVLAPKGSGAITSVSPLSLNSAGFAFSGSQNSQILSATINSLSGSTTNTNVYLNSIVVTNDSLAAAGGVSAMQIFEIFGGATTTGGRTGLNLGLLQTATTGNLTSTYYTALDVGSTANANDNGTAGTYKGNVFAANFTAALKNGATYFSELVGLEIDIDAETGSSVAAKIGLQIVLDPNDQVSGTQQNNAFQVVGKSIGTASGWNYAYAVGAANGVWPMASSGTTVLFGCQPTSLGGNAYAATYGVKLDNVTFATAAFQSAGFLVDGSGNETVLTTTTHTYTVATLPAAGTKGRRAFVSDATATTFGTTVAGGGSNNVPVFDNGTAWVIG